MTTHLSIAQPIVTVYNNKIITTSLDIANCFSKQHKNVLRTISNLECSPEFTALNFELSTYTDCTGRALPVYNITRDGFIFLVTGFTGKKAAQFKEAYIKAFNEMEKALLNQVTPKLSYRTVQVSKVNIEALINHMEWIYKYYKEYNLLEVSRMLKSDFGARMHDHIIDGYLNARSII